MELLEHLFLVRFETEYLHFKLVRVYGVPQIEHLRYKFANVVYHWKEKVAHLAPTILVGIIIINTGAMQKVK